MNVDTINTGVFTPSSRSVNSFEEVVAELRAMIRRGDLGHGDRLPPERDLSKMLGVSRPTLRAAIRSLAAVGVLRSKRGAGTFVVEAEKSPILDGNSLQMLAALGGFTREEMFEARIALEMSLAALAAARANGSQLKKMSDEIAGMFAALDEPEDFFVHDMNFHQTIADASGNRILTSLMNMITKILSEARRKNARRADELKTSAEMHQNIYQAIRRRSPEDARAAMREHLTHAQKFQQEIVNR